MHNDLTTQRVFAIDTFRGITILVMIFVNEVAGVSGAPDWMKHMPADADAMTFVDVVFPAFLFIVGMSIPFAINIRRKKGDSWIKLQSHILVRTLGLIVLGVFMVNAESGYNEQAMGISIGLWSLLFYLCVILVWNVYETHTTLTIILRVIGVMGLITLGLVYRAGESGDTGLTPQWWGILGLIGWAYLFGTTFYQLLRGNKWLLFSAMLLCVAWFAFSRSKTDHSFIEWMKSQSGHAIHTALVLCGMILSLIFFDRKHQADLRSRFLHSFGFAALSGGIAFLLRPHYQISKIYATPSWAMYSAMICILLFMLLYWIIDVKKWQGWTSFIRPAATNPLLTYIIPFIIIAALTTFDTHLPYTFYQGNIGIVWAAVYAVSVMAVVIVLNKWKIRLQL